MSDVLAIHPGAVGDVVLLGQLLARLGGRATVVARGQRGRLLTQLFFSPPGSSDEHPLAQRAIDFESWALDDRVVLRSSGRRPQEVLGRCHRLLAFYPPAAEEVRRLARSLGARQHWLLPIRPEDNFAGHLIDAWTGLMNMKPLAASARQDAGPPVWRLARPHAQHASALLPPLGIEPGRPYLVIHPGSGGLHKCWPLARFGALARDVRARRDDLAVLAVVGEAEMDRWGPDVLEGLSRDLPLLRCTQLLQLAGLLAGARAYVGNDSGPSHLAAALGVPTVALFGPTNPVHFAPLGPTVRTVKGECMEAVTVEQVMAELATML